ncbi:MAG: fumarate hydratase [Christensenellaceae bacterium]
MREIHAQTITQTVKELFLEACLAPTSDINIALQKAYQTERTPHAKEILSQLIENNKIAVAENIPACQDTGMAVIFADVGQDVHIIDDLLENAVNEGVRQAYADGYYRKSVLSPLSRKNTLDNTPAIIHIRIVAGSSLTLTAAPKGFGSENMSKIAMLKPSDGVSGIVDFVVDTAKSAGGSPCPPVVLGIGIGGTFEYAALLAKRQLLREVGSKNDDATLNDLENEIKTKINALGMGPMGLSGDTYCLAVHIATFPTHIAGLPVAVNYCCHMLRHAQKTI